MKLFLHGKSCRWLIVGFLLFRLADAQERSIRFFGHGAAAPSADRISISLAEYPAVNVNLDFTIECWLKCEASNNKGTVSFAEQGDGWITGNVLIDRDIYGIPDAGDFGISIGQALNLPENSRVVAFGISRLGQGVTIQGKTNVADNRWHHIAVTRNGTTGEVKLFIDGKPDAWAEGPAGRIAYNLDRKTSFPDTDPYLVIGAEKHNTGELYPSYNGMMDELRISGNVRYSGKFNPEREPFDPDANTAALYHFNENGKISTVPGAVTTSGQASGPFNITEDPAGPSWVNDSPFSTGIFSWHDISAKKESQKIAIGWTADNRGDHGYFEVQRSTDNHVFTSIGTVKPEGDCDQLCHFRFNDTHPFAGKNYYRIVYRKLGENASISPSTSIVFGEKLEPYRIFRNGNTLIIRNTSTIESLVVWSSDGKRLIEKKNLREGTTQVNLGQLQGFAFIHINLSDGTRYTERILAPVN